MAKTRSRRTYSDEFKAVAMKLVLEQGMTGTQAAKDTQSVLSRWVKKAREEAPPGALSKAERDQLKALRRENEILRQERDILKKAAAFSAKEA